MNQVPHTGAHSSAHGAIGLGTGHAGYGVRLVRGPFVKLTDHADACRSDTELAAYTRRQRGHITVADLFSGAGGLSLGLEDAGLRVVMAVDHDDESVKTHRHHFGGLTIRADLGDPRTLDRVARLIGDAGIDVIAGGPPCQPFSKAGRSGIRHWVRHGMRDHYDARRDLWQSFLQVVTTAGPRAVLMENVPDMALDREMLILRTMVEDLESCGYAVSVRVVDTYRYGVPQFRQRLILVAMREGLQFSFPPEDPARVNVRAAISDLPEVAGGWRPEGGADGWADYDEPTTEFQRAMRRGEHPDRVYDHITRPVREDDAAAFELMTSRTRYSDLPEEFKRYREDIFGDKYKRLDADDLSRTITAHIAKDGYSYIHPHQNRTITVREAARLQTFPDRFRFSGPPSAAFRQIGNAVPPRLGYHLGRALALSLNNPGAAQPSSRQTAATLAAWYRGIPGGGLARPWLRTGSRWQVILAELALERADRQTIRTVWPTIQLIGSPGDPRGEQATEAVADMTVALGRPNAAARITTIREALDVGTGEPLTADDPGPLRAAGIPEWLADLALLAAPATPDADDAELPVLVTRGVLRVAARYTGNHVDRQNRLSDGRVAVARLIGGGANARTAHLALVELAASVCRPEQPHCAGCPLSSSCLRAGVPGSENTLF